MATDLTRPVVPRATEYPQHDVIVDGLRLRYIDVGPSSGGDPASTLLVIPGHTARIEGFDEVVPALAEAHRVLVLDLPGSGYSDKPDRKYTLTFYEDTLLGFLDALELPVVIPVGGSLGGNLVLRLGHRDPVRFPVLVAWAPGGSWPARPPVAWLMRRAPWKALFWPTVHGQSRFWYSKDWPRREEALQHTFEYYREIMCPGFINMYWGIAADQIEFSLQSIAAEIAQPTLLMWGDRDNGGGMGAGVAKLRQLLPDCTFHVFEGARHSLEAEIPDQLVSTIVDWLASRGL